MYLPASESNGQLSKSRAPKPLPYNPEIAPLPARCWCCWRAAGPAPALGPLRRRRYAAQRRDDRRGARGLALAGGAGGAGVRAAAGGGRGGRGDAAARGSSTRAARRRRLAGRGAANVPCCLRPVPAGSPAPSRAVYGSTARRWLPWMPTAPTRWPARWRARTCPRSARCSPARAPLRSRPPTVRGSLRCTRPLACLTSVRPICPPPPFRATFYYRVL